MRGLLWNTALALVWVAATGRYDPSNFLLGFGVGLLILFFIKGAVGSRTYIHRILRGVELALYFLSELIQANVRLAYDVVTPDWHMRPAIVAVPLDAKTDAEITLLANLISLTPGTLSIDVSEDRSTLYLHVMYIRRKDLHAIRQAIKSGFERRVLEFLR